MTPTRDVAQGRDVRVCADESRPVARADLTGSLTSRSTEERSAVPVAHAGPSAPYPDVPYQRSVRVLTFALHGLPISQGSKSFKGISRSGRAIMVESSKALKPWRNQIQAAIRLAVSMRTGASPPLDGGFPLLGPLAVELVFTMRKPVGAPKTRRTWPVVYPDIDKLCRAVLDEGKRTDTDKPGLWHDDSQVVDLHAWKVYPLETPRALRQPGLHATVYLIDPQGPAAGEQDAML